MTREPRLDCGHPHGTRNLWRQSVPIGEPRRNNFPNSSPEDPQESPEIPTNFNLVMLEPVKPLLYCRLRTWKSGPLVSATHPRSDRNPRRGRHGSPN